jgi:hypothetical protein
MMMGDKMFNKFDLVLKNNRSELYVVLMGPLEMPYHEDGIASDFAFNPLDFQNPKEWQHTFTAYILFNTDDGKYVVTCERELVKYDSLLSHIPFDNGTAQLRRTLGLLKLGSTKYLEKHMLVKEEKKKA